MTTFVLAAAIGPACGLREAPSPGAPHRGGDIVLRADVVSLAARVAPGQTFATLLRAAALRDEEVVAALARASARAISWAASARAVSPRDLISTTA